MEEAFKASKQTIIAAIREGVKIYDMKKRTCRRPYWSRQGMAISCYSNIVAVPLAYQTAAQMDGESP